MKTAFYTDSKIMIVFDSSFNESGEPTLQLQ